MNHSCTLIVHLATKLIMKLSTFVKNFNSSTDPLRLAERLCLKRGKEEDHREIPLWQGIISYTWCFYVAVDNSYFVMDM